jgi:hypothetical protein
MTTIGEAISRVRGVLKIVKQESFTTDRFIYSIISKYAKTLIRRQDNENKIMKHDGLFIPLPFVELIDVDKIEAGCAAIQSGCLIKRTELKLPKVFNGTNGPLFRKVYALDGSQEFYPTTPTGYISIRNSVNFKYNKTKYYFYRNGYMYFPDCEIEAVAIEGLWEDTLNGFCNLNGDCKRMQELELPIPEYLFTEIEQMLAQELNNTGRMPSEGATDNINPLR